MDPLSAEQIEKALDPLNERLKAKWVPGLLERLHGMNEPMAADLKKAQDALDSAASSAQDDGEKVADFWVRLGAFQKAWREVLEWDEANRT